MMLKPADIPAKDADGRRVLKTTVRGWEAIDDEFDGALTDQAGNFVDAGKEITLRVAQDGLVTNWCFGHDVEKAVWQADPVD